MKAVPYLCFLVICLIANCSSAFEHVETTRYPEWRENTETHENSETKRNVEGRGDTETLQNIEPRRNNMEGIGNTEMQRYTEAGRQPNIEMRRYPGWRGNTETYENADGRRYTEMQENVETSRGTEWRGNTEMRRNMERSRNTERKVHSEMQGVVQTQRNKETIENDGEARAHTENQNIIKTGTNTGSARYPDWKSEIPTNSGTQRFTEHEVDPSLPEKMVQKIATNLRVIVPQVTDTVSSIIEALAGTFANQKQLQTETHNRFGGYEQRRRTLITTTKEPTNNELTENHLREIIENYQRQLIALQSANQEKNIAHADKESKAQTNFVV